jgi:glucose/mannose-6-phosphate isomerase
MDIKINLDRPDSYLHFDTGNMLQLTLDFPQQCREAQAIGEGFSAPAAFRTVKQVMLCGLGGSAIAGDLVSRLLADRASVPLLVNRQYELPPWVGKDTLVVLSSYSGNTEETLSCFKAARERKCPMAGITSGGKLAEMAAASGVPILPIPGGRPPRASTGYLIFPFLAILEKSGLTPAFSGEEKAEAIAVLEQISKACGPDRTLDHNTAKDFAYWLLEGFPVIYGWGCFAPVALRWQTQFNENSKIIAHAGELPEMNHNEVVAWAHRNELSDKMRVILLRAENEESAPITARLELTKRIIGPQAELLEAWAEGEGRLARQLSLVYRGDIISVYLAFLNGKDPIEINAINFLKGELAKRSE